MSGREPWFDALREHVAHIARGCRSGVSHNPAVHEQVIEDALAEAVIERRAADALADACDAAVRSGYIGSRSEIADALLGYRDVLADTRAANSQSVPE